MLKVLAALAKVASKIHGVAKVIITLGGIIDHLNNPTKVALPFHDLNGNGIPDELEDLPAVPAPVPVPSPAPPPDPTSLD